MWHWLISQKLLPQTVKKKEDEHQKRQHPKFSIFSHTYYYTIKPSNLKPFTVWNHTLLFHYTPMTLTPSLKFGSLLQDLRSKAVFSRGSVPDSTESSKIPGLWDPTGLLPQAPGDTPGGCQPCCGTWGQSQGLTGSSGQGEEPWERHPWVSQ